MIKIPLYTFLFAICFNLVRSSQSRRIFYLLVAGALPVVIFAVLFDGRAVGNYLPLYQFIFLALSKSLANGKSLVTRICEVITHAATIVVNVTAVANVVLDRQQEATAALIAGLQKHLDPENRVVTVTWQDPLVNFHRSFLLHLLYRMADLKVGALITPGAAGCDSASSSFHNRKALAEVLLKQHV